MGNNESVIKRLKNLTLALMLSGILSPAMAINKTDRALKHKRASRTKSYKKLQERYLSRFGVDILNPEAIKRKNELRILNDDSLWELMCLTGDDFIEVMGKVNSTTSPKQTLVLLKDELKKVGLDMASVIQERIDNGGFSRDLKCTKEIAQN